MGFDLPSASVDEICIMVEVLKCKAGLVLVNEWKRFHCLNFDSSTHMLNESKSARAILLEMVEKMGMVQFQ